VVEGHLAALWVRVDVPLHPTSPLRVGKRQRVAAAFPEAEMPIRMGKYVRAGHVQDETHWMKAELVPNGLAK